VLKTRTPIYTHALWSHPTIPISSKSVLGVRLGPIYGDPEDVGEVRSVRGDQVISPLPMADRISGLSLVASKAIGRSITYTELTTSIMVER
jgi:hypothetical protein